jgi:acyl-CoA thioester hydrolase
MSHSEFADNLQERSAYKFWVKDRVRFTDLDALGHVSAVRTNEFFNGSRASLFHQAIKGWPHSLQLPVMKLSVVLHIHEIRFPDELDIGLVIESFGKTSVTVALGVFNSSGCLALSRNVFVFIDTQTRQPCVPVEMIKTNFLKLASH